MELGLLTDLLVVASRLLRVEREDERSWTNSPDGRYSVKSAYYQLLKGLPTSGTPGGMTLQTVLRFESLGLRLKLLFSRGSFFLI